MSKLLFFGLNCRELCLYLLLVKLFIRDSSLVMFPHLTELDSHACEDNPYAVIQNRLFPIAIDTHIYILNIDMHVCP